MARRLSTNQGSPSLIWWAVLIGISLYPALTAATPVGYEETGFTVRCVSAAAGEQIESLADADALLSGQIVSKRDKTKQYTTLNFVDPGYSHDGHYRNHNKAFPTNTRGNDNNFAVQTSGLISIASPGDYTFGTNSDDGVRVTIDGQTLQNGILHQPHDTLQVMHFDTAGVYSFDLTYFEHKGLAELEFFAAAGDFTKFRTPGASWALVGDTTHGGLETVQAISSTGVGSEPTVGGAPPIAGDVPPVPIPEPTSGLFVLTAAMAALARRRR